MLCFFCTVTIEYCRWLFLQHSTWYTTHTFLNNNNIDNPEFTADTIFGVASISKQFTAAAILLLQERKRLNINTPIGNYLQPTSFPAKWDWINKVTILELLQHTSGLPDDLYENYNCSQTVDNIPIKTMREH